ncbi:MAG TPA: FAD-dependent oxidoreductase, partial [Elusimicrobiota bacterium]|nr:FAD-dependent oxidoreductase [Elusimicrobiota bacterium]
AGALVMGGYEHDPLPWALDGIPRDFNGRLLEPDFDHFEPLSALAIKRVPLLENVGIKRLINGPEAFTPDGTFIMGESPEVRGFFVAAGFNAHGIAAGGGAGKATAEWIVNGEPSLDLWAVDIRRFSRHHRSPKFILDRTSEAYGHHYSVAWPDLDWKSCRGLRRSPLYETLKRQGACYASKQGWERPNWFAPSGVEPVEALGWGRPNYFSYVGAEHKAAREGVVLFDQTPFSKFEIKGRDALKALNFICANQLDKPVGSLTYTQMCNRRGGIECDLTVARTGEEEFYVVTGTAFALHDGAWIRKNLPEDAFVTVSDATSGRAVVNVCGPRSRELLRKVVSQDISNEAFPFMQCRELAVGCVPVLALRVTYIGELGYELHIPAECASYVYELLWKAGEELGVRNAGYRAIESLRLEKGYRYWGAEISGDYNPFEAGLGFAVKLDKGDFLGREALRKIKAEALRRKLCAFTLENPETMLYGNETISCGDEIVGRVTSGGYGYTAGKCIAYGYVSGRGLEVVRELDAGKRPASPAEFSIESLGERIRSDYQPRPLYDPKNEKVKS